MSKSSTTTKTAKILDGVALADEVLFGIRKEILESGTAPGLAAILIGDNPASQLYVDLKEKAAEKVGIRFSKYLANSQCYGDIDEYELAELINFLNNDPDTDAILLQLPLPKELDQNKIVKLIKQNKDADGFNRGPVIPPTINAIIKLLTATGENLTNKKTLIIGNSDIFISELSKYLKSNLKIKDIATEHNIPANSQTYDILISAIGRAEAIKKPAVKPGAIVIDVGINKIGNKTVGDVSGEVAETASYLSPVPGGVGPLTVAQLMSNVWELSKKINS